MNKFIAIRACPNSCSFAAVVQSSPIRSKCIYVIKKWNRISKVLLTSIFLQKKLKAFSDQYLSLFTDSFYSKKNVQKYFMSCKQNLILNNKSFYGHFYLGPFQSGQSITVANALRRTLLSELSGIAIIGVEIEGVTHEYSNISGLKDTVLDILLNLKEIILKSNYICNVEKAEGFLQVRGPGIIRACDIKLPSYLLCVDPDQYIATLSDDGFLNMKLYISSGENYSLMENSQEKLRQNIVVQRCPELSLDPALHSVVNTSGSIEDPGFEKSCKDSNADSLEKVEKKSFLKIQNEISDNILYLDPVFIPVTKINYVIEQNPQNFLSQILVLEIWTNGSIHPRKALYDALKKLINIFYSLKKLKMLESSLKSNKTYKKLQKKIQQITPLDVPNFHIELRSEYRGPGGILDNWGPQSKTSGNEGIQNGFDYSSSLISPIPKFSIKKNRIINSSNRRSSSNNQLEQLELARIPAASLQLSQRLLDVVTELCSSKTDFNKEKNLEKADIGILNLSLRTYSSLKKADIQIIKDFLKYSPSELLKIKNLGQRALLELQKKIKLFLHSDL